MAFPDKLCWGWIALILILIGSGCTLDKSLPIASGTYAPSLSGERQAGHPPPWIGGLEVDREAGWVRMEIRKGGPLLIPFTERPPEDWPAGCPGGLFSQRMEVFDLHPDPPAAELLGWEAPILVRNCPEHPYQLVLRQQGELGGPFSACPYPAECLYFSPASGKEPGG